MSVVRIASRYAKSLLDLAQEQGVLEEVVSDMKGFGKLVQNRDLYLLIKSPIIKADKKKSVFQALFADKINKLSMAFFEIVLKKGREQYLPEIAHEFVSQYKNLKGISTVELITATPITEAAVEQIKSKMLASNITAKSVEIETIVDPQLVGGFVIRVGDKLINASVAHQLKELSKALTNKEYEKAF